MEEISSNFIHDIIDADLAENPDKKYTDFPFSLKKMSSSGCLYDINKLTDVSKNVISRMDADTVNERLLDGASEFDP